MKEDRERETPYSFYVSEGEGEPRDMAGMPEGRRKVLYEELGRQFITKGLSGQVVPPR